MLKTGEMTIVGQEANYGFEARLSAPFGYIYKITNLVNGKVYVGQTTKTIAKRWSQHKAAAIGSRKNKQVISRAIEKYGESNFKIEEIYIARNQDVLDDNEKYFIRIFNCSNPIGYNTRPGGKGTTEETKQRMSKTHINKYQNDPELGKKQTAHLKGKPWTAEHRYKIGSSHRGVPLPDEVKHKISNTLTGKKQTPEQVVAAKAGVLRKVQEYYSNLEKTGIVIRVTDKSGNIIGEFLDNNQCAKALNIGIGSTRIREYLAGVYVSRKYNFELINKNEVR